MKPINKKQSGFAILEVALAVLIMVLASLGIFMVYSSTSAKSQLSAQETAVSQLSTAFQQYVSVNYTNPVAADALPDLIALHTVGSQFIKETTDKGVTTASVVGPYGAITVTPYKDIGDYSLTVSTLPGEVAQQFASDMLASADVTINGDDANSSEAIASATIKPAQTNIVVLKFPKGGAHAPVS
ncbi:MAG: hypothetical protein A3J38_07300 [Gammaproteobacteria bacterium RIFCSPHIGHO2_12_FULL_45_9]|nr:MAG: hypothetical protein A3J38_07300 [Gammaproteobacteria bacterium RIFCSPHIGHO2_12_FULL_45_9]